MNYGVQFYLEDDRLVYFMLCLYTWNKTNLYFECVPFTFQWRILKKSKLVHFLKFYRKRNSIFIEA